MTDDQYRTHVMLREHWHAEVRKLRAENERLRESLTWAVWFIRCNTPDAESKYPDMRNACDLVNAYGVMHGEFQKWVARAELAEHERDRLRAELEAKDKVITSLSEKLAACAELLTKRAERPGVRGG